jgi:hypothetical protein
MNNEQTSNNPQSQQLNIAGVSKRYFKEFKEGDIVKYQWLNEKPLRYRITKVWKDGYGFFDLKIIDEDANYNGHFYEEYLSVTYRDLCDANVC